MQAGKLPIELLSRLLGKLQINDPRVVLGPRPGEDAALIDFGDRYLVAKTDPITFATDLIGWYMVQVNSNDLAVMGATPRWLMATLLFPEGTSAETIDSTFDQMTKACDELDISLIGGHTEITYELPRPIAVGALLGEVEKDRVVKTADAQVGDSIILTKGVSIEGTSLLAREASEALLAYGIERRTIGGAQELLFSPGISVVKDAAVACQTVDVHAMHDPTEGGLATGLLEMAIAADLGLIVEAEKVDVVPECRTFCDALGLDPMGLIASGSLLAAVAPEDSSTLVEALADEGIAAAEIGRFTPRGEGLKLRTAAGLRDLPRFARDEIARYFGE